MPYRGPKHYPYDPKNLFGKAGPKTAGRGAPPPNERPADAAAGKSSSHSHKAMQGAVRNVGNSFRRSGKPDDDNRNR